MKSFRFSLESVLKWRTIQLEQHEEAMRRLNARLAQIVSETDELRGLRLAATREVIRGDVLSPRALRAAAAHRARVDRGLNALKQQQQRVQGDIERERTALLDAQRGVRVLERLRDRQLSDYVQAADREVELLAAESSISRWQREHASEAASAPRPADAADRTRPCGRNSRPQLSLVGSAP